MRSDLNYFSSEFIPTVTPIVQSAVDNALGGQL